MNIIVPIKQVPDLIKELEIDDSGKDLNRDWLEYKINEFDDHALEEALCLKDDLNGSVTVIALEGFEIEKSLYITIAKGAGKIIKVVGDFEQTTSKQASMVLSQVIQTLDYDLILTGVHAADDRDGQIAVLLAHLLGIPHVSVVTGVHVENKIATIHKEYSGGIMGEFEVDLPAVLGIQAARQTPRYAPVSRVRQAMRNTEIEEVTYEGAMVPAGSSVQKMSKPEKGQGAKMIEGSPGEIANQIISIVNERGIKL